MIDDVYDMMDGYDDEEEEFVDLSDLQADLGANGLSLFKSMPQVASSNGKASAPQNNHKVDLNKKRYDVADTQVGPAEMPDAQPNV